MRDCSQRARLFIGDAVSRTGSRAAMHRSSSDYLRRRVRSNSYWTSAQRTPRGGHGTNLVFAVPVALAGHRVCQRVHRQAVDVDRKSPQRFTFSYRSRYILEMGRTAIPKIELRSNPQQTLLTSRGRRRVLARDSDSLHWGARLAAEISQAGNRLCRR